MIRRYGLILTFALTAGLLASGCVEKVPKNEAASGDASQGMTAQAPPSSSEPASPQQNNGRLTPDQTGQSGAAAGSTNGAPEAPFAASGGSEAPSGAAVALKAKADALEAKLKKNPGDAKLKKDLAEAYYQEGAAIMFDDNLPPRQKYRPALLLFNQALQLNPKHAKAAEYKSTIESIYKQMGMPIPQ